MKALFITFEGIEGCGKSTQSKMLNNCLLEEGYQVLLTREPGGPVISEKIRHLLLDIAHQEMTPETEILLYMASRAQHTAEWIIPALKQNAVVICDRYYDSTFAYQGSARKIDLDTIRCINTFATYGKVPDLTFYIDIPVDVSIERIKTKKQDRLENECKAFHEEVKKGFDQLLTENPDRYVHIDGQLDIETIHNKIKEIVLWKLKEGKK
jgi:dTMP kinase